MEVEVGAKLAEVRHEHADLIVDSVLDGAELGTSIRKFDQGPRRPVGTAGGQSRA
ncbi:MAG TPA: hypothetical protein VGK67_01830 [Myxococcales bacterium]